MISARRLVIIVVVLHEEGRVLGQRIDNTAAELVFARLQIGKALGAHGRLCLITRFLTVGRVEISLGIDTGHIVHGRRHCCLDAGIQRGGVERHTAPAADADDADTRGIDHMVQGKEVHRSHEILCIDIRRGHIADVAAALAGERGIKGQRHKAALRHRLGVETGALLLDCAEGTGNGDCGEFSLHALGNIQICRQGNAVAVDKRDLAVIDLIAPGKSLVPFPCELQFFEFHSAFSFTCGNAE